MEFLILIILIGLLSYVLVKRSAGPHSKTPLWLLWTVIMTPAFSCAIWLLIFGENKPIPIPLFIAILLLSLVVYSSLQSRGKPTPTPQPTVEKSREIEAKNILERATPKTRPISQTEETALRDCFPWSVYYLQKIDYHPQAILCRGRLKTVPENAYKAIKKNVEKVFGDRFLLIFQENLNGEPFFALVPNVWAKQNQTESESLTKPNIAIVLLLLTFLTTTLYGLEISDITREQLQADPGLIIAGIPYSLGIILVFGLHELSHYLVAVNYKIRTTLPYFIPFPWFLGTFGAFIQMRSPFPHRKALFDISIAGPIASFLVSLPLLFFGLAHSEIVDIPDKGGILNFNALNPRFSLFMSLISKFALGESFLPGNAIDLHPSAVAGYVGILITALNLMPIGQLDGGHIVHGMFGQATGAVIGQLSRIFLLVLGLIQPGFLIWAIILFFMPVTDQPALNDVTELDNLRDFMGLVSLALLLAILLPLPGAVAGWLNI